MFSTFSCHEVLFSSSQLVCPLDSCTVLRAVFPPFSSSLTSFSRLSLVSMFSTKLSLPFQFPVISFPTLYSYCKHHLFDPYTGCLMFLVIVYKYASHPNQILAQEQWLSHSLSISLRTQHRAQHEVYRYVRIYICCVLESIDHAVLIKQQVKR